MSESPAIQVSQLSKCYQIYQKPQDRLKQFLWRGKRQFYRDFWALRDVSFNVSSGEVIGIIGNNGSGKSTLLQLVCGTLTPSSGTVQVNGRIAALLELGAGFNPDFTGRENIYMSGAILGLTQNEIAALCDDIIEFSGIRPFIDQPVKTYSSGMYVRLAFSVAVSVEPDILIIDEALSVGDGAFSYKSFGRIMALKERGATILFCSHSMYQVEALCSRALWLEQGTIRMFGLASDVTSAYSESLDEEKVRTVAPSRGNPREPQTAPTTGSRLLDVGINVDGVSGKKLAVQTLRSTVSITVRFASDSSLPSPSVGVGFVAASGITVATAGSLNDQVALEIDANGNGVAVVEFPDFALLKGVYTVAVFLLCDKGLLCFDQIERAAELHVTQSGLEQGFVTLPHRWKVYEE